MFTHKTTYRVLYGDTDQMGYLYYGHYAKLYEVGRAEMIRSCGITYQALEAEHHIKMPVMRLECKFLRPALYDELLTIETTLEEQPTKMITFHHKVFNPKNELLNKGVVTLFFVDEKTQKRISIPPYVANAIHKHFV